MNGYFDFNATTPLSEAARDAWLCASEKHWHNPSSLYREAGAAKRKLEEARERLAVLLGCEPERIVFTSGATESNNALFAFLKNKLDADQSILSSAIEHPSVREPLQQEFANRVSFARTTASGELDMEDFARQVIRPEIAFATVMSANNECGLLHPWKKIAELCLANEVPFHTDAAQWIGKLPSHELGRCDYVTGCAHKFGGPKGVGFLVMRDETEVLAFLRGGPQEEGRRAGTENYPGIEAMVTALKTLTSEMSAFADKQVLLRDAFETAMLTMFDDLRVIGAVAERLWNTSMFVLPRHDNRKWLARLSQRGFAVSTGSACSAGRDGSSVVLAALGASDAEMRRVIRVSGGWQSSPEDWRTLLQAFFEVGQELDGLG